MIPAALVIAAGLYLFPFMLRTWVPHDAGLLGQSAERVLQGELPHRDFEDAYTGGLSFLHAAAFQLLGMKLTSLRWVLFASALAVVPALYGIAVRAAPPWLACLVTAACVVWSVPNYPGPLPTWYVLFLTIGGTYLLIRYGETGQRRWLLAAGVCGGLSLLFKIFGLYFLAAASFWFVFRQLHSTNVPSESKTVRWVSLVVAAGVSITLLSLVALLLRRSLDPLTAYHYLAPIAALCVAAVVGITRVGETRVGEKGSGTNGLMTMGRSLASEVGVFYLGVLLPVVLFLIPYAMTGSLADLLHGVIVLPQLRLSDGAIELPPWQTALLVVVPIGILLISAACEGPRSRVRPFARIMIGAVVLLLLLVSGSRYYEIWYSLRWLLPMLAVLACLLLVRARPGGAPLSANQAQNLFLVVAVAALFNLVQHPTPFPWYFCYCAPLVLLSLLYVGRLAPRCRFGVAALLTLYLAFAVVQMNRGYFTVRPSDVTSPSHTLDIPRGGLLVSDDYKRKYESLVALVQTHSAPDTEIFAAPDCPQVYFLCERRNPTRTMYDFFDTRSDRTDQLIHMLDQRPIAVVVINRKPVFSGRLDPRLVAAIESRFDRREDVGEFTVAWRSVETAQIDVLSSR